MSGARKKGGLQLKESYRYDVDGEEVILVDGRISKTQLRDVHELMKGLHSWNTEYSLDTTRPSHLSSEFLLSKIRHCAPFQQMEELLRLFFPDEKMKAYRAYCNMTRYGDVTTPHRDCPEGERDITCLYYANASWKRSWGGETLFYNHRRDTVVAINPLPGRIVLFRGSIEHRNGVPERECMDGRFSIAYKFRSMLT